MRRFVLVVSLFVGSSAGAADTQMWSTLGLTHRASKTLSLGVSGQLRFDQNLSRLAEQIGDAEVHWRVARWLRLGLGYRLAQEKSKKDVWRGAYRPHVEARFKVGLGAASLSYRLRLQNKTEEKTRGEEHTLSLRHRLSFALKVRKNIRPVVSAELYTRFDEGLPRRLHKIRLTTSLPHKLNRRSRVKGFLRLQVPVAQPDDPLEQIVGVGYEHSFRR